ncbi:cytochrome B561 [Rhodovulum sp. PH10]|uniref:cytochrome b n=1 Tax=Rhodovulum sp. PH10 TaxID=1187851 RepID=UPI00027C2725|nr:cytochrome b [Rhodovulum sp. PH10]EJW13438.1 cytochrome B561 [Rhodovulum sp. PH10]
MATLDTRARERDADTDTRDGRALPGYTLTARTLHWVTAAIVITMIPMGFLLESLPRGPIQNTAFDLHRSFGILVLLLVVARFVYRQINPPPPLPADVPGWQRSAAHANHYALYALLILQPLVGWVATSAYGAPVAFFWLFELPPAWPQNKELSHTLFELHGLIGLLLGALIVLHVAAALHHHFGRHDATLMRMLRG